MWLEVGNLNAAITRATSAERAWLREFLSFPDVSARFTGHDKFTLINPITDEFPAGFVPIIKKSAAVLPPDGPGFTVEIIDTRTPPAERDIDADLEWLRDYQYEGVNRALERTRGILWLSTGAGKTEIAIGLVKAMPIPWLFLVHRGTLGEQTARRFEKRWTDSCLSPAEETVYRLGGGAPHPLGEIREGEWSEGERLTIATFQTIARALEDPPEHPRGKRVRELLARVRGVIVDECFPAGTLVDGQPIESFKPGDLVTSYDETTQTFIQKPVLQVFSTPMRHLLRVHFDDGRMIVCTCGHPFLTNDGWHSAISIAGKDVLCVSHDSTNLPMRKNLRCFDTAALRCETTKNEARLLEEMPTSGTAFGCGTRETLAANDQEKPDERSESACEDVGDTSLAGRLEASDSGRKRARAYGCTTEAFRPARAGLDDGVCRADVATLADAEELQDRYCTSGQEDRNRGRRRNTQDEDGTRTRCTEGPLSFWSRVARIEILEPRDSEERERLCPGGIVYNLHVKDTENYIVNGAVVHNCHVLPADSYWNVMQAIPDAYYRIGLSGTPLDRGDKRSALALAALGPIIYRVDAERLVAAGVLARPRIRMLTVQHPFSKAISWQDAENAQVVRSPARNAALAGAMKQASKPGLLFVKKVEHGKLLSKLLWQMGVKNEFVWGNHSVDARKNKIAWLTREGDAVLICSVVFQEGVDIPALRSVGIGSGGKSVIAALQRIGRGMRVEMGKTDFEVYDVLDKGPPRAQGERPPWVETHANQRKAAYISEGFETVVLPPGVYR